MNALLLSNIFLKLYSEDSLDWLQLNKYECERGQSLKNKLKLKLTRTRSLVLEHTQVSDVFELGLGQWVSRSWPSFVLGPWSRGEDPCAVFGEQMSKLELLGLVPGEAVQGFQEFDGSISR